MLSLRGLLLVAGLLVYINRRYVLRHSLVLLLTLFQIPRRCTRILHWIVHDRCLSHPRRLPYRRRPRSRQRDSTPPQVYMALLPSSSRGDRSADASRQGPYSPISHFLAHLHHSFTRAKPTCTTRLGAPSSAAATPCSSSLSVTSALSVPRILPRGSSGSTLAVAPVCSLLFFPSPYSSRSGHNIELMDKHFSVSQFDAIYLIDLCEPLLEVARKRFARKGWRNITVLCQDATEFSLPEWSTTDPKGSVNFITLSYSLSMVCPLLLLLTHFIHSLARFQTFMPSSIVSTMSSLQRPACSASSTFIPRDVSLRSTRKPSGAPARNAVGSAVGSGRSGSTLITCHCLLTDATTSSTSLARYVQHPSSPSAWFSHLRCRQIKTYNGRNHFIIPFIVRM